MFILLTYDIDFESDGGRRRLSKVAKLCEGYGVRVQKSVFEMSIDISQLTKLKYELKNIIDTKADSIRIYKMGKTYKSDVTVIGIKEKVELSTDDALFF
ncbi:MAG: CRISPR-associated endonuclease Cas2 [Lachnospiraceae bacterium]